MFLALFFGETYSETKKSPIPKIMGPWKSWLALNLAIFGIYSLSLDSRCLQPTKLSIWILFPPKKNGKKNRNHLSNQNVFLGSPFKKKKRFRPQTTRVRNWASQLKVAKSLALSSALLKPAFRHHDGGKGALPWVNIPTWRKCWANLGVETISNWEAIFCFGSIYIYIYVVGGFNPSEKY